MSGTAQKLQALERANDVRLRRARFRDELRHLPPAEAKALLAAAIGEMPDWLEGADVELMLCWCPKIGTPTARRLLHMAQVFERRRLRQLTDRQRKVLGALLLYGTGRR